MRKRTRSREFALQILYEMDIAQAPCEDAIREFWEERTDLELSADEREALEEDKDEAEVREYSERLVRGVHSHLQPIDATIEKYAENWKIERMACVDRNILRLAAYEILHAGDIPLKVAINEAVELAKRYGESDSSKFVNGILDRIAKTHEKGAA